jgi:DNA-binding transcriptional ArsR family regulator
VDLEQLQENARIASNLLKAMCNERRLLILCQLLHGEKTVGELEGAIGLSQSALSQHLAILRQHDLVKTRREAQSIYYSLSGPESRAILETLYRLYATPQC